MMTLIVPLLLLNMSRWRDSARCCLLHALAFLVNFTNLNAMWLYAAPARREVPGGYAVRLELFFCAARGVDAVLCREITPEPPEPPLPAVRRVALRETP